MLKDLVANFYEIWGLTYLGEFSVQMYNNDLYLSIAVSSIIVALVITLLYYYVIDRPSTGTIGVWLIALLLGGIISLIIAFVSANNALTDVFATIGLPVPPSYTIDIFLFSLINAMWVILLMVLLSISLKWKSTHSSFIPF